MRVLSFFALAFAIAACGGSSSSLAPPPSEEGGEPPDAPGTPPVVSPPAGGPSVTITMAGSKETFAHADAFAGQTPHRQVVAVKSLWLYRSASDPAPLRVFDHGKAPVEVDLVTETPVEVAKVALADLADGTFTVAKAGVSYVRYSVDATVHVPAAIPGVFDNVQALSDGAVVDGVTRARGWYRYSFSTGGYTAGPIEASNAPTPTAISGGGITMDMSGPETFYVFPVDVVITKGLTTDQVARFVVNVDHSFRWQDVPNPGYATDVFDTTTSTFEPVMAFGANSFRATYGDGP